MFEELKANIKDLLSKVLAIIVLGLNGVFVLFILSSYFIFFKLLCRLPFYQIPMALGVYAFLTIMVFIKFAIVPYFSSHNLKQENLAYYTLITVSFVNYLVIYQFIKPEYWFSNRSFFGLILKTVLGSLG